MNTILSIDLDILFSPYIGIYNNYIGDYVSYDKIWQNISNHYIIEDFKINQEYFEQIKKILLNYSNKVSTIHIGLDHTSILEAINNNKDLFNIPYNFNIYNIDFHHDIAYRPEQFEQVAEQKIATCASWVGYLHNSNYLNSYYWYRSYGSEQNEYIIGKKSNVVIPLVNSYVFDNNFPLNLEPDLFFISLSIPWIPPTYYDTINSLLLLLPKEKIKYYLHPFFNNGIKEKFLLNKGESFNDYFNFYS